MGSENQEGGAAPREYLLCFVCDGQDQVYIHADEAGPDQLARTVTKLLESVRQGRVGHEHLISEEWGGGGELTASMLDQEREAGCTAVHHVKIYAWTSEGRKRDGL